ncbi:hypothetical protein RRG08_065194 [Elysia crispata]|uniref:Uncharacterized protein n=1 Tax=Elysia crispata TaxID=231223 RepID=A0AAE0Z3W7_9GAST|nr:hypothetical protein RRG08_065194 [Elysia crispata]
MSSGSTLTVQLRENIVCLDHRIAALQGHTEKHDSILDSLRFQRGPRDTQHSDVILKPGLKQTAENKKGSTLRKA